MLSCTDAHAASCVYGTAIAGNQKHLMRLHAGKGVPAQHIFIQFVGATGQCRCLGHEPNQCLARSCGTTGKLPCPKQRRLGMSTKCLSLFADSLLVQSPSLAVAAA